MNISINDVRINYETEFKKLVPKIRRAAKRLKHAKPKTELWHKESRRLQKLIATAPYLQEEKKKEEEKEDTAMAAV